jgi:uncharacterized protein (DUF952 family)
MKYQNVYKILSIEEWDKAQKSGFINTDLDIKDGYIHFSTASQLATSLELYFSNHKEVILLLPNMKKIGVNLKYESTKPDSKRNGFFAHLYSDLSTEDITKSWLIKREFFKLPISILLEAESI